MKAERSAGTDQDLLLHYREYYLRRDPDEHCGERTMYIRRAFREVQRRQSRRYALVITTAAALLIGISSYVLHSGSRIDSQRQSAERLFYTMKSIELELAKAKRTALARDGGRENDEIRRTRGRLRGLERSYDRFLYDAGLTSEQRSEEDQLIMKIARTFGEYELEAPVSFSAEVKRYIRQWQSTGRFVRAINDAKTNGYIRRITTALINEDLPPQLFYLALQESNFNVYAVGPPTNKGIAKGMWQFLPATATHYGLELGPLYKLGRPDPHDERHDLEKSTQAAARYLRDIYANDAQASALLVMASYNWGEGNVASLIDKLPPNPHDRNFWRLLSLYRERIPHETYDYVFYIVSAAVIGENPRLFGFDLDNPLGEVDSSTGI